MNYALIKNGSVVNIIIATSDFIQSYKDSLTDLNGNPIDSMIDVTNLYVCIGFTYDGENFYPPIEND